MSATRKALARILVVGIVVVEVRYLQTTMRFDQGMDNGHLTDERERKRRREHAEGVRRDKDACRPGSHVFGPQCQHSSERLFRFYNRGELRLRLDRNLWKAIIAIDIA